MATLTVEQQINQLNDARKLVLSDANYYTQIIQGILPIIGPSARVELRRWGADFLAETFSSPTIPSSQKETLSLVVLDTLKDMIENPHEDSAVVKSIVQTAASIYPLVVRWIINNPYDIPTWERMVAIKTRILRMWDTAKPGIRICCIKFAQRVVLVQTTGPDADSRRGDPLQVSLSMVPPNHTILPPRNLEAEASGLLDRLLSVFQENSSDAVLVDATLNSLSILIRARPHVANKILNVLLNFNPLKLANSPMTPKLRVMVKSMEKTTRSLLIHISKRDPHNPLNGRIQQYVERMMRSKTEIFDEGNRKRGPPEPVDALDPAKRQKLGAQVKPARLHIPPLAPGNHTIAELFTITTDEALKGFDVALLSEDLVVKIGITILQRIDMDTIEQAISGVKARLQALSEPKPEEINPETAPLGVEEDDDDYEPDFYNAEDTEQILNKLDSSPPEELKVDIEKVANVALGPFTLPPPPSLNAEEVTLVGQGTVSRVFGVMQTLEEPAARKAKAGINRLAASAYDRDAWITIITRLATRAGAGLEESSDAVKLESPDAERISLSNTIRQSLLVYILEDFRKRIDIAVAWLCEEWYNDKVQMKLGDGSAVLHYEKWTLKVLDGISIYLDAKDKVLTRFLSEIPGLSPEVLNKIKGLCKDPTMVNLSLTSLLYLVMMRPPVRDLALDAVEDIWNTYDNAKPIAAKYLKKWRPGFEDRLKGDDEETKPNGMVISS
ncbi:putative mrna cleavage and polyadenylation specificity factor complex subunit protein [Botrytis fragariae]|uniref:Putative mrna cleavage and polyadenylation specificity factor complex subunit protein n=1 Tax=Botrytis fragariae TaxID=1964551 RepID=A0A8H6ELC6_9HELO|nr:putative mrna cleavage and polyadenylation specificity factor complex subunit protein [Botrytis fragariae]KAF5876180.1 putative mrna cleavage and polyadenylation specificity factor complex subunit protein [Botrytis fragariae]